MLLEFSPRALVPSLWLYPTGCSGFPALKTDVAAVACCLCPTASGPEDPHVLTRTSRPPRRDCPPFPPVLQPPALPESCVCGTFEGQFCWVSNSTVFRNSYVPSELGARHPLASPHPCAGSRKWPPFVPEGARVDVAPSCMALKTPSRGPTSSFWKRPSVLSSGTLSATTPFRGTSPLPWASLSGALT